ncbi:MAG: response regulator transcription factor, partial [Hyphomicrobiales bacterium]
MKLVRTRPVLLDFDGRRSDGGAMSSLILIADDDAESVEALDACLRREGFRTVVASDGQQAADLHAALKPDLVLLNIRLPIRDGWDVLGELRRRGETPVIMVSDLDLSTNKLQALRIGADDYVVKPFKPIEV